MGAIADKRLGDFVPTIDAYRPVALTVAAILGLVLVLPGADRDGSRVADLYSTPAADEEDVSAAAIGDDDEVVAAVDDDDADVDEPVSAPPRPGGSAVTPRAPAASSAPDPATRGGGSSSAASSARSPSAAPAPAPLAPAGPSSASGDPLRIAGSGWASTTGGTPVPTAEAERIPEGTLPVGNRLGQVDKASFVRLSGEGATLVLGEDASGRRGGAFEVAPVQLCQITDEGWEEVEGQAMSEAPAHDPERCAPGQQRPDGTWAFTLSVFDDPADPRGFAIVPTADAPIDFQLTFAGQAIT